LRPQKGLLRPRKTLLSPQNSQWSTGALASALRFSARSASLRLKSPLAAPLTGKKGKGRKIVSLSKVRQSHTPRIPSLN
jgi:hypothetical protein